MVYEEHIIRKSRRRAWMNVVTGFVSFFFIYGIAFNCLGLFMTPMAVTFSAHRATVSSLYTVMCLSMIPIGLIVGRYNDKHDIKLSMALGCICAGSAFILYGLADQLWVLYLAATLEGMGLCLTIQGPIALMINYWFAQRKGTAMGITMVGSGVGGTVLSQVLSRVILADGWQTAYIIAGILTIACCTPLVLIFVRKDPHAFGMYKYGEERQQEKSEYGSAENLAQVRAENSKISKFGKTPEFWMLFFGLALIVLPGMGIKAHMVAYMTDIGYKPQIAADILSLSLFAVIFGKPILGWLYDKIGAVKTCIIAGICMALGILFINGSSVTVIFAIAFGIVYGFGSVFSSIGPPLVLSTVLKTDENFATIMAFSGIGMAIFSAFGTLIVGAMFDATGTYILAFTLASIVIAVGFVLVIISIIKAHNKNKDLENKANANVRI